MNKFFTHLFTLLCGLCVVSIALATPPTSIIDEARQSYIFVFDQDVATFEIRSRARGRGWPTAPYLHHSD